MPTRGVGGSGASPDQGALALPAAGERVPLAARMRPRTLEEFEGQEHLVGERGPLRRAIEGRRLSSMVLWGPPGSGKTTLARLLAEAVGARFSTLSAVMSGVADVRRLVADARAWLDRGGAPTVLFIDEIHRFNKAQQDALLPHVEDGTVTLIGATTENPYFEVTSPLLSRVRVFRLEALTDEQVGRVVGRALADPERGYGGRLTLADEAFAHLVGISGGDARQALNVLEAAVAIAEVEGNGEAPTLEQIERAAQQRVLAYDRAGDGHYDTVSAFIKSLRGNDPDAALYWLATMIAAGEDPRFVARRMIIAASEDVGNADPRALQVAVAAAEALEWVGLPEAQYALAQAAAYVASAPKSNRAGRAYWAAMADVQERGSLPVPMHLRNAPVARMRTHGIGVGYRYPHDYAGADVEQRYLPDALAGRRYYVPSEQGMERQIGERLERIRSAREAGGGPAVAAMGGTGSEAPPEVDPMRVAGRVTTARQAARQRIAESERRDAEAQDERS